MPKTKCWHCKACKGQVYSIEHDAEDNRASLDRGRDDRHRFRFLVSAVEGLELTDLRETTRELMKAMGPTLERSPAGRWIIHTCGQRKSL